MNREVHYELTKRWAIEEGFSEEDAEKVAASSVKTAEGEKGGTFSG